MRALSLTLALILAGTHLSWAQVEHARPQSLSLDMGIVAGEVHRIALSEGGILHRTEGAPAELNDFSLSFVLELEGKNQDDDFLTLHTDGETMVASIHGNTIHVRMGELSWDAPSAGPLAGRKVPVTLSVKRDARQALSGLWVDGVEQSSVQVRLGKLRLRAEPASINKSGLKGGISQINLYDRALTRDDVLEFASRVMLQDRKTPPAFKQHLDWIADETIAFIGGTEAVALLEDGTLEAMLLANAPDKHLKLRSLAWETDTVWRQDRPLNFGGFTQQLQRVNATTVVLMFGRQECQERGEAGVDAFREAMDQMVKRCSAWTPRIILVAPPPFETGTPPQPDLKPLNGALATYRQVIQDIAAENHLPMAQPIPEAEAGTRLTRDGVNLSEAGIHRQADQIAMLVSPNAGDPSQVNADFLAAIRTKNHLWHDYWRPSNWAFLYGDRTAQPSSRDHLNPQVRWFPAELEKSRALIEAKEQEIWKLANGLERRVP